MQSAIKTRTERLHINMCGGLIGIEYVGAGALTHRAQQSKVNAKTVIGFARSGRTEALAIIKLCLYYVHVSLEISHNALFKWTADVPTCNFRI